MKRIIPAIVVFFLLFSSVGFAKVSLGDSPIHLDSKIAATEFGASSASFCPLNDYIYYLDALSGTSFAHITPHADSLLSQIMKMQNKKGLRLTLISLDDHSQQLSLMTGD